MEHKLDIFGNHALPQNLKSIQPFIKLAEYHLERDEVIYYWSLVHALQLGLKLHSSETSSTKYLCSVFKEVDTLKNILSFNEAITAPIPAHAHIENYALRLFIWADTEDRNGEFTFNVVKTFYTVGLLFDLLESTDELTDENQEMSNYAKWKAAYINSCLKNGEEPVPGPFLSETDNDQLRKDQKGKALLKGNAHPKVGSYTRDGLMNEQLVTVKEISDAKQYCKFAASALDFEDVSTAVDMLEKALLILKTSGMNYHEK